MASGPTPDNIATAADLPSLAGSGLNKSLASLPYLQPGSRSQLGHIRQGNVRCRQQLCQIKYTPAQVVETIAPLSAALGPSATSSR